MDCFCSVPRSIHCKIILLDEQELLHEIQDTNTGQAILDVVFRHLNLLETAYFGLRYMDIESQTHWIDPEKKLSRQLKGPDPYTLYFGVKFYAADPCKLLEEITRYQFFLQVKQDILQGRLPVSFELAAELGAYIVQSELGDYDSRRHSTGYVSEFRFLSNQTVELETRIIEIHKTLVGQLPSVAELNYLDKVKWLEMYGVDLHPVLGEDNVEYYLGLTPNGIIVLRNKNIVGNYFWPRISKIYFKGRYFMLRVTDKNNDESTYGFETPSKPACKHLWKCCVEHHAFFRLVQVSPTTSDIFAIGSRFRYSGRTEKQAIRDAQMRMRNPPLFLRTPSRRYQRRTHEDSLETNKLNESMNGDHYQSQEIKHVSIPQPAQLFDSPYRATCNTSTTTDVRNTVPGGDSPRSTRSAPWSQTHLRGLYNTMQPASPRSVRSAGPRYRSSSIDSQSSNDSKSCKRRRQHRSKWTSDNESELSKCSSRSHRKHKRHRSRGYKKDSGSEQDFHQHRHKSSHKNRHSEGHYELVDSGSQWREVQKRQEFNTNNIQQANVVVNRRAGYVNNGLETESEISSYHYRSKHRKHRSRSRSPSTAKTSWLPDELKKHLEFDLIDTTGMSESQLREIPYTVVETNHAKQLKLKNISRGKSDTSLQNEKILSYSPPPPYSPQISDVSRIRGGIRSNSSNSKRESPHSYTDFIGKPESSIASSSSTQSNSNMLPRMFDSLSLSNNNNQYQMSIRSVRSRASNNSSSLYGNSNSNRDGITNSSEMHLNQNLDNGIRVNHEHTDSGLGVEQECIYNNERSNNNSSKHEVNSSKHLNDGHGVPIQTPVSNLDCVLIQSNYNNNNSNINTDFRPSSRNSILDQYNHPVRSHFETVNNTKKNYYDSGNNGRLGGNSGNISVFRNVYTNRFDYNNSPKFTHNIYNTASFGSSSDEQKRLATTTTENNNATIPATSLFRGSSNFSTTTTRHGYSHDSRYNLSTNSTSSGTNNTTASYLDIKDGPLRLQYRMGGHSVRSTRSTKSEGRTKDHSNQHFFYSSNQTVNANQINHLKVPSPLTDYKRNGNEENKSKITASNVIQDNHMCNGTRESAEMSTEL